MCLYTWGRGVLKVTQGLVDTCVFDVFTDHVTLNHLWTNIIVPEVCPPFRSVQEVRWIPSFNPLTLLTGGVLFQCVMRESNRNVLSILRGRVFDVLACWMVGDLIQGKGIWTFLMRWDRLAQCHFAHHCKHNTMTSSRILRNLIVYPRLGSIFGEYIERISSILY